MQSGSLRKSLPGLVLGISLTTTASAEELLRSGNHSLDGLLIQLVYLPAGLIAAALLLEVFARIRGLPSLHRGVSVLLVATSISALIALLISSASAGLIGQVPGSPFSAKVLGIAFTGFTLLTCFTKFLSMRPPAANLGENEGNRATNKKRGRGRGRRRRAAARQVMVPGRLLGAMANGAYALSATAAVAALAAAPLLSDSPPSGEPAERAIANRAEEPAPAEVATSPTAASTAFPANADDRDGSEEATSEAAAAMPLASTSEPEPIPGSHPEPKPEPEQDPAPATEPALGSRDGSSTVAKIEPAPATTVETAEQPLSIAKPEPESAPERPTPAARPVITQHGGLAGAETYQKLVQPLLRNRCYDCHGEEKQKGDLRLDTPEGIRLGGKSGAAIIAGSPEKSYLMELISLDDSDDDIMPPKGKPLSAAQISWIGGWIREGADLGDGVAWPVADTAGSGGSGSAAGSTAGGVAAADGTSVQALLDGGVIVRGISSDGSLIEVDYSHADRAAGALRLDELKPIAVNIHTLDLKRTKVADADLGILASMPNLHVLHLQRTGVTDAALVHLASLEHLESLNLYSTQVSDAGLAELKKLTSLKKVYLWSSQVTAEGARELASVLGADVVNMGE